MTKFMLIQNKILFKRYMFKISHGKYGYRDPYSRAYQVEQERKVV